MNIFVVLLKNTLMERMGVNMGERKMKVLAVQKKFEEFIKTAS